MKRIFRLFILFSLIFSHQFLKAQTKVLQVDIKEEINPTAWRTIKGAFKQAQEMHIAIMLINLNTYGGMLEYADSIRTKILNSPIKTVVFIDNNAASAGALISIACDKIYMQKGATIGAASVVDGNGALMPEKYQSYMRGLMRTTAEAKGRNPKIAEAFVDPDIEIDSLTKQGKVLTLTTKEAMANGYCINEATSVSDVLTQENAQPYKISIYHSSITDHLIDFLTNPVVSSILILLMIGGIYFEFQSPGIGVALLITIIAAILFFAPLYLEGLASNWEILLFILGVLLLALELLVIPGFGIFGILGIVFIVVGLAMSMILNNFFDLGMAGDQKVDQAFLLVLASVIGSVALSVFFGGNILKTKAFQRLVLKDEQQANKGDQVKNHLYQNLIGKSGFAKTDLKPSGKIEVEGNLFNAISFDGFIENGTDIIIYKVENSNLIVRRKTA